MTKGPFLCCLRQNKQNARHLRPKSKSKVISSQPEQHQIRFCSLFLTRKPSYFLCLLLSKKDGRRLAERILSLMLETGCSVLLCLMIKE